MALLKAQDVTFSYDKKGKAVNKVNIYADRGEYIAIIGHNGSGKSTLARLFNGLLLPDQGEIVVDGFCSSDKRNLFEIRKRVGVVFQNPDNQIIASIVEDDVAFGPENLGIERKEIGQRIDFALNSVGMQDYRKKSPTRLSGGQKQRIAIAGVLALKPEILVLDESTAMLDPQGREEIAQVVKKLNKEENVTIIAITHYMEEVVDADRVYVLNNGEVAFHGTPKQVFAQRELLKNIGLEVPISTYIAQKLAESGVDIESDVLTEQELKGALCKLLQKT